MDPSYAAGIAGVQEKMRFLLKASLHRADAAEREKCVSPWRLLKRSVDMAVFLPFFWRFKSLNHLLKKRSTKVIFSYRSKEDPLKRFGWNVKLTNTIYFLYTNLCLNNPFCAEVRWKNTTRSDTQTSQAARQKLVRPDWSTANTHWTLVSLLLRMTTWHPANLRVYVGN